MKKFTTCDTCGHSISYHKMSGCFKAGLLGACNCKQKVSRTIRWVKDKKNETTCSECDHDISLRPTAGINSGIWCRQKSCTCERKGINKTITVWEKQATQSWRCKDCDHETCVCVKIEMAKKDRLMDSLKTTVDLINDSFSNIKLENNSLKDLSNLSYYVNDLARVTNNLNRHA